MTITLATQTHKRRHQKLHDIINKVKPNNLEIIESVYFKLASSDRCRTYRYNLLEDEEVTLSGWRDPISYQFLDGKLIRFKVATSEEHITLNLDEYDCEEVLIILGDLPSFKLINTKGVKTDLKIIAKEAVDIEGEFDLLSKLWWKKFYKSIKAKETKHRYIECVDLQYLERITHFDMSKFENKFANKIVEATVDNYNDEEMRKLVSLLPNLEILTIDKFNTSLDDFGEYSHENNFAAIRTNWYKSKEECIKLSRLPESEHYILKQFMTPYDIIIDRKLKKLYMEVSDYENPVKSLNKVTFSNFPTEELFIGHYHFKFADKSLKVKSARSVGIVDK